MLFKEANTLLSLLTSENIAKFQTLTSFSKSNLDNESLEKPAINIQFVQLIINAVQEPIIIADTMQNILTMNAKAHCNFNIEYNSSSIIKLQNISKNLEDKVNIASKESTIIKYNENINDIFYECNIVPVYDNYITPFIVIYLKNIDDKINFTNTYHEFIEKSLQGLIIIQNDSIIFSNPAFCEICGFSQSELLEMNINQLQNLVYLGDRTKYLSGLSALKHGVKNEFKLDFRIHHKKGHIVWVQSYYSNVTFNAEKAVQAVFININNMKNAEKTLLEMNERLSTTLDSIGEAVIVLDSNATIIRMNPLAEYLTGWDCSLAIGKSLHMVYNIFDIEDNVNVAMNYYNNISDIAAQASERNYFLLSKTAKNHLINNTLASITKNDGSNIGYIITFRDISEDYSKQKALKESEDRLNLAQAVARLGSFEIELNNNNRIWASEEAFRIFGLPRPTAYVNSDKLLKSVKKENRRLLKAVILKSDNKENSELEIDIIRDYDKEIRTVIVRTKLVEKDKNLPPKIVGTIQDITDRKRTEEEIKNLNNQLLKLNSELESRVEERTSQLQDALEELRIEIDERNRIWSDLHFAKDELAQALMREKSLNELKTRFVSMVSHEYRAPLTIILSSTYILEKCIKNGDNNLFNKQIKRVQESVNTMTNLLDDVLTLGKCDLNNINVEKTSFDLKELCRRSIEDIKYTDKRHHIFNFDHSGQPFVICSDYQLLTNAINNILSNAVKYSYDNSQISIHIQELSDSFVLTIEDHGIGIPEKDLQYLFEPFHRSSNAEEFPGTGLGLTISKRIIESLNGKINVSSKLNTGTTFIVRLPRDCSYKKM